MTALRVNDRVLENGGVLAARLHRLRVRRAAIAAGAFRLEERDRLAEAEARCHAYARYERALYKHMNASSCTGSVEESAE